MYKQVRSIMCGCGNCCIRKNVNDTCPQALNKDAIQLWYSDFSEQISESGETPSERDPTTMELLQEIMEAPLEY